MADDKEDQENDQVNRSKEDKALDSVTDYHEDREMDLSRAKDALSSLGKERKEQELEKQQRDKELAKVQVSKEHIEFIVNEFEVDKFKAERLLRESGGDPAKAIRVFLAS